MQSTIGRKRSRGGYAVPYRRSAPKKRVMRAVSRVPRAIATRGTPSGYYEIPVNIFRKIYWNMSTGLWETNQTTGASVGATGYNGFSFASTLDTSLNYVGGSGVNNNVTVPGFSEMQAVFDQCKIVRIEYEFWFANQAHEMTSTSHDSPELFMVTDYDNIDVPTSIGEVMQYSKIHRVVGNANIGKYKLVLYPKVRTAIGSDGAESGTTTTLAGSEAAGYQDAQKPASVHMGLRGWFNTNSSQPATLGYLHILERQIRRYKITK